MIGIADIFYLNVLSQKLFGNFLFAWKQKLCYVALDYEAELSKDTNASYEAAGEGWFTLSKERFQTPEVLFKPHFAGV